MMQDLQIAYNGINMHFIFKKVVFMNLRSLETLVRISELGSFAKVAENYNMTISTVSMQMKALEEELQVSLFDRAYRPPKLTPMGRVIAVEAIGVLKASKKLYEKCRPERGLAGEFHIGFVLTSSIRLLPSFLEKTARKAPNAQFRVETGLSDELASKVASGQLDAAIVTGGNLPQAIAEYPLQEEEMLYCLPKRARNWAIEKAMAEMPFIHFLPQTGIGRLIEQYLKQQSLKPANVITLDSVEAVCECVRKGVGFSILPGPDVLRNKKVENKDAEIITRSLLKKPFMRSLVLAYLKNGVLSEKIEIVADMLKLEDLSEK